MFESVSQETKSAATWEQLLTEVLAKHVVDVTPSLACAEACVKMGVHYTGLVGNATQLSRLSNSIDRASMKFVVQSGSYLYEEDLATHIKALFSELVDGNEEEPAVLPDEDDEVDGDA